MPEEEEEEEEVVARMPVMRLLLLLLLLLRKVENLTEEAASSLQLLVASLRSGTVTDRGGQDRLRRPPKLVDRREGRCGGRQ